MIAEGAAQTATYLGAASCQLVAACMAVLLMCHGDALITPGAPDNDTQ